MQPGSARLCMRAATLTLSAEEIAVADHRLADVMPIRNNSRRSSGNLGVDHGKAFLDGKRALCCIERAREFGEDAVAGGIGDGPSLLGDQPVGNFAMRGKESERCDLVHIMSPRIARNIGAEDRRQAPFHDCRCHGHCA